MTRNRQNMLVQVKNIIITPAKYYIFQTKHNEEKITFNHFKFELKQNINNELQIAQTRNNVEIHSKKWKYFLDLII